MKHVTRVESNLKTGASLALAPKTLIVGPNGAGKSAVVNAVEAALSGTVSDVAGRTTVSSDALLRLLVPPGAEKGVAQVVLTDGEKATFEIGTSSARIGPGARFPLREVYDHLLGTAATAQKWLLRLVGMADLPDKVEALAKQAREETAKAKTLRGAAVAQASGLRAEYTAAEIADLKAKATGTALADAQKALDGAQAALLRADARVKAMKEKLAATPGGNLTLVENGEKILGIIRAQFDAGATSKCGLCGNPTTDKALHARAETVEARIAATRVAVQARAAVESELQDAIHQQGVAQADARRAHDVVEAAHKVAAMAEPAEVARVKAAWDAVRKAQAQAEVAEANAAMLKAQAKTAADNMATLSERARLVFVGEVQRFLPAGDVFDLALDPPRFGLKRGDTIVAALSGAEWARVTAAIASAVAASDPEGFSIVIPEERAFDPETLSRVLAAFSAVESQVLFASPIMPTSVPEGWAVVRVGNGEATKQPADATAFDDAPAPEAKPAAQATPGEPVTPPVEAKPEKKTRKLRRKKGESDADYAKRTEAATAPQGAAPGRSLQPENGHGAADGFAGEDFPAEGAARPEAGPHPHASEPGFCAECRSVVALGTCEHGVSAGTVPAAPQAPSVIDPSAFD